MDRKISLKKYLIAFVLTLIIFSGGIVIGLAFEYIRLNHSEQTILAEKVSLRSLQLQQNYIDSGLADCNTLNQILETNINELGKKMVEVISYEKTSVFNQKKFNLELQDYFLTEIQFLLTSQEIDKKCTRNNLKIIYFYNDDELDTQGKILDYLKKLFGDNIFIFSLDSNFKQEPMINILLSSYNIKQFPAIVIEKRVLQQFTPVEELMTAICEEFFKLKIQTEECILFNKTTK